MIADFSSSQMISWQTFWAEEKKRKEKRVWRQFLPFHSSVCCVTGRVLVNWLCGTISLFFSFSCFFFSFPRKIFPKKKRRRRLGIKKKRKKEKKSPIADGIVVKSPPWQTQVERITYGGWEQKGVVELEEQEGRTYSVIWRKQGEREKKKKKKKAEKGMSGKEMNQKARRHQSNGTESARAYYNDPPFKSAAGETSFHQQVNKVNTE